MLEVERRNAILALLKQKPVVRVTEISRTLFFSEATVRRDLVRLEKEGLITRVRGGAILNSASTIEIPTAVRTSEKRLIKREIASLAAEQISNNQTLFLDSSTTVLELIPHLQNKHNLTIITNGLLTVSRALELLPDTHLYLVGGLVREHGIASIVGATARNFVESAHADAFFFSVHAIDHKFGMSELSESEVEIKRTMMSNCDRKILLADSTKFGNIGRFRLCGVEDVDSIVTDSTNSVDWSNYASLKNPPLLVPCL